MFTVSADQLKAARAMLNWSQQEIAVLTGLGLNTIRRIEEGNISPRVETYKVLRQTIENAGYELIEDEGIKKRNDLIKVLKGKDATELLCADIAETIKRTGGEIYLTIRTAETLKWFFSTSSISNYDCFSELKKIAAIKCLLFSMPEQPYKAPAFEYRMVPRQYIDCFQTFVYGDHYATVIHIDGFLPPQFIIFRIRQTARNHRHEFEDMWKMGQPILVLNK